MKTMSNIERRVMAGVAAIFIARTLVSVPALKFYALVLSLWGIGKLVWVSRVVENFFVMEKSGVSAVSNFLLTAVAHAHLGVQLVLIIAALAAASLLVDVTRAAPGGRSFAA